MPFNLYAIVLRWFQTALNVSNANRVKAANIEPSSRLAVFPTMYLYLQIFLVMIGYLCHFVLAFLADTWDGGCWTLIAGSRASVASDSKTCSKAPPRTFSQRARVKNANKQTNTQTNQITKQPCWLFAQPSKTQKAAWVHFLETLNAK